MILSILTIVFAIAEWGGVHSSLASPGAKDAATHRLGGRLAQGYRFLYNVFSVITFAPILLLVGLLPDRSLYLVKPPLEYVMLGGQLLAILGAVVALKQTDALSFVGLKQLVGQEQPTILTTSGLYRYVRHPMYFFSLVFIWLTPVMTMNTLTFCIGLTAYFFVGAYFEERKLARVFGRAYEEYR